jgi:monoamine oxidase
VDGPPPDSLFDVLIIGAGASGLAAARDLSGARKKVAILEARDRIGGRIWTQHSADLALPIELGAEFIHGEAEDSFAIVESAGLLAYELPDDHRWARRGKLHRVEDYWELIHRVRSRIPKRGRDVSFAEFLKKQRNLSPKIKRLALQYVEGYHAAHADRISAATLRASDEEQEDPKQFRIANGYDALLEWLRAGLDPERSLLRLATAVTRVKWKRGHVEASTRHGEVIRARAAVITIPVGVWKAPGGIEFDPPLAEKENALAKVDVGHVVKIIFRFRERFWEKRVEPFNFMHASDRYVPTWWTTAPVRTPLLTAWAGGHAADALLAEGSDAIAGRALDSLASTLAMKRREIDRQLDSVHFHDWQADPFSRGAYSYARVGGENAHAALAKPVGKTLFFAGEGTSSDETGTVSGAIKTGKVAARYILRDSMR